VKYSNIVAVLLSKVEKPRDKMIVYEGGQRHLGTLESRRLDVSHVGKQAAQPHVTGVISAHTLETGDLQWRKVQQITTPE
jgi:hypothetical protein